MTRLEERPAVERKRFIAAPREVVWSCCIDLPSFAIWRPEHVGGAWIPPATGATLGAQYRGENRTPTGATSTTISTITVLRPPEEIAWVVGSIEEPAATWSFVLKPSGSGTLLRQRVVLGTGASPLTEAIARLPDKEERIIAQRCESLVGNIDAVLAGIVQRSEAR